MRMNPVDRFVGDIGREVITLFRRHRGLHSRRVPEEIAWLPLAFSPAHEAVEVFEAQTRRPVIEWAYRTNFPKRGVVPLAESSRTVAVPAQHLGDGYRVLLPHCIVAREPIGQIRDSAESNMMMIAA